MPLKSTRVTYAGLRCVQIDGGAEPDVLVVVMHGFGAPGDDLVSIQAQWVAKLGDALSKVRFVFPAGPVSLDALGIPGGRAWWPLNMAKLMEAMETRDFSELRTVEPPGLAEARTILSAAVDEMLQEAGTTLARTVLGGFSQGAMLAADTSLRGLNSAPAGLMLYSGTLICEHQWKTAISRLSKTQTIISHGTIDPILPFEGAESLVKLFKEAGVPVRFLPFVGQHQLTLTALDFSANLIKAIAETPKD